MQKHRATPTTTPEMLPGADEARQTPWSQELIAEAATGDGPLARLLVRDLTPIVRARVWRRLSSSGLQRTCGEARFGAEDLAQEAFAKLFERNGRVLRQWDPARGLSLANFVGLVTERYVGGLLRARGAHREIATEEGTLSELNEFRSDVEPPSTAAEQKEMLDTLRRMLSSRISKKGMAAYHLLFVEQRPVAFVAERLSMNASAVYAWRSRLRKHLRLISTQLALSHKQDWAVAENGAAAL